MARCVWPSLIGVCGSIDGLVVCVYVCGFVDGSSLFVCVVMALRVDPVSKVKGERDEKK